jgi:hypothetical protein
MDGWRDGLCLVLIAGATGGCATTSVSTDRTAPTGIAPGDAIAVVAWAAPKCEADASRTCPEPLAGEGEFDHCVALAMQAERPDLLLLRLAQLERIAPSAGPGFPRNADALMPLLQANAFRRELAAQRVRYVVVVRGHTATSESRLAGGSAGGREWYLWSIGGEWERTSNVRAEVLDVGEARQAGTLAAFSRGKAGFQVPVIAIIPLPPVPYSSPTESSACEALGKSVLEFILHQDR